MGVIDWFRKTKFVQRFSTWRELGKYNCQFTTFGGDIYASDIVRSAIRPLAEHTSKANAICTDKRIEKVLSRPNMYMNGKDFLAKVRTRLEIQNSAFIYIMRDDRGHAVGFYPVPYSRFEALEYQNGLFLRFYFDKSGHKPIVLPWADLAALRKDYNESDIAGDDNRAILGMLDLICTTNQGIANAVKATANLRGILKSTKAMLSPNDVKAQKDAFVEDYLNLENAGGIASLDATQEFTPITMNPTVTSWEQQKEFRENVYRYFGISDAIVMSNYTESQMEAFYESRIEPFLLALSQELTNKVFTEKERSFGNQIVFEANRLQFATMTTKISVFKEVVLYGGMTVNEWRIGCNMAPIEGGDELIRRLDAAAVGNDVNNDSEEEVDNDGTENE